MLNIYVCEDIEIHRRKLKNMLENIVIMEELDMEIVVSTDDPQEVLSYVKKTEEVGIYFLDIDLKTDMNGLILASKIRKYDPRGFIVFVTSHSNLSYMTFQYKLEAMDYIIKEQGDDMVRQRVCSCLKSADERFSSGNNRIQDIFTFKINNRVFSIDYDDIIYFETSSNTHKVILHGKRRVTEFYGRIKELEQKLDGRFYRSNRSFLLNRKNIKEVNIQEKTVVMVNGEICPISIRRIKGLREK